MKLVAPEETKALKHPLDLVEEAVEDNGWPFERSGRDEINLSVAGRWSDYHFCFTWRDDLQSLHVSVSFDMRVNRDRRSEIAELLMAINAQVWLGHFDLWSEDGAVLFRHVLIFPDSQVSAAQCEALLHLAIEACEHYYPAFQFVLWGGKTAREAMAAAVLASPVGKLAAAPMGEVSVRNLGQKLMTDYVLPLEVMALLLTAAMLGAVIIAMKDKEGSR